MSSLLKLIKPPFAVSIYIRNKTVYIPSFVETRDGFGVTVEPVYESKVDVGSIVEIIKKNLKQERVVIDTPTKEEFQKYKDVVLNAMKVRSWKALGRDTGFYAIEWFNNKAEIALHEVDKQLRPVSGTTREKTFPIDTPLEKLVEVILEDVRQFPHIKT